MKTGVMKGDKDMMKSGTFGCAGRANMGSNDGPAPNKYRPVQFTEASHCYSFPRNVDNMDVLKDGSRIGPGEYKAAPGIGDSMNQAKSILGGSRNAPEQKGNGFPGPDAYQINSPDNIPGFVIHAAESKSLKEAPKQADPVGPQRYNPHNPNHHHTDWIVSNTIGNATRGDMISGL